MYALLSLCAKEYFLELSVDCFVLHIHFVHVSGSINNVHGVCQ